MKRKAKVYKTATKVRARQLKKTGVLMSVGEAKGKARQIVDKRKNRDVVETVFRRLTGVGSGASRSGTSDAQKLVSVPKPKKGPTKKTKTVRRIAERKGISRAAANKIRKARKS